MDEEKVRTKDPEADNDRDAQQLAGPAFSAAAENQPQDGGQGAGESLTASGPPLSEPAAPAKKKKKIWPYVLMIVIGLLLLTSPLLGRLYGYYQDQRLLSDWADEDGAAAGGPRIEDLETAFDLSGQDDEEASAQTATDTAPQVVYKPTVIGSITIPKLNLVRPIANDDKKRDLRVAIGKIPGSSGIGQAGNCSLAGHRNYLYKEFFDNIDKLVAGDKIILKNNKGVYTYEVYDRFITTADDNSVLTINKSESIVTLITCHPKYINTDRLIVKAKLVEAKEK